MRKNLIIALILCIMTAGIAVAQQTTSYDLTDVTAITVSLVNQDPDPALAGDTFEVRVGLENLGGDAANNIMVELVEQYPFTIAAGQSTTQKIGTISAYQDEDNMRIVKFQVNADREATAGSYELKINYYEEGSKAKTQKSLYVDIQSRESAEVIYIDKTVLIPGKQTPMKFTINNVGSSPLRELTFYWENDDKIILPVGSDNTKYIRYIDVGDSAELKYEVIADTNADPGLYPLSLHLTYDNPLTDSEKEISTIAGVYVGGETDFDIAYSDSTDSETSFTIANIGSNPAFSVSVMVPEQDGWSVSGSNAVIIGNLNKGDYTVASFTLQRSRSRPSGFASGTDGQSGQVQQQADSEVTIKVAYTDTKGDRKTVTKEVQVSSTGNSTISSMMPEGMEFTGRGRFQQQSFWSEYKWYISGIVAIVLLVVLRHRYKKKKLLDPKTRMRDVFKK